MQHAESHLFHRRDDRARRGGSSRRDLDPAAEGSLHLRRCVDEHVEHDRCPAHVCDPMLFDHGKHQCRVDLAQAHVSAADCGDRPGEGPPVAVEHRQGPQVGGVGTDAESQDLTERIEVGPAVVGDHALGVSGGAGGIAEADRLPLVAGMGAGIRARAFIEESLVVAFTQELAAFPERVVDVHHQGRMVHAFERGAHTPENSRSVMSTLVSAWPRMKRMVSASRR